MKRSSASGPPPSGAGRAADLGVPDPFERGCPSGLIVFFAARWPMRSPPSPSACSPATSARWRGASRSSRTTTPRAGRSSARSTRTRARPPWSASPGPPGAGKSTLIGALIKLRRARRPRGRGALDRPVVAVPRRRAARRPHPADRALPRPRRLHPLDGDARRARRARRGRAADGAADGRRRQGRRVPRDGRRRPGRGRRHRPRRLRRARADPGLGRLDPGAQGRRDGDPRRDRGQQVRPPADRHDGARDPRRAVARARRATGPSRSSRPRPTAARASSSSPRSSPSTASSSSRRGCWPSAAAATS